MTQNGDRPSGECEHSKGSCATVEAVADPASDLLRTQLSRIGEPFAAARTSQNLQPSETEAGDESGSASIALQRANQTIRHKNEDHGFRLGIARAVGIAAAAWLVLVLAVVVSTGLGCLHLSDNVLGILLLNTTAQVIGTFYLVMKFFFHVGRRA